jgi:hypothetical protein
MDDEFEIKHFYGALKMSGMSSLLDADIERYWIRLDVKIDEVNISANGKFCFYAGDLIRFFYDLVKLDQTFKGQAALESDDGMFSMKIPGDQGPFAISGSFSQLYVSSEYLFELELDQSYLHEPAVVAKAMFNELGRTLPELVRVACNDKVRKQKILL